MDTFAEKSFYVLVQGKYYKGDIEGKRYHWRQGIPGSKQLFSDLRNGYTVRFLYYRTWDRGTNRGKFFYGSGEFDNQSFIAKIDSATGKKEYYCNIKNYYDFAIPVSVSRSLWEKIWTGANRQPGIRKIPEEIFNKVVNEGMNPEGLESLANLLGENFLEDIMNERVTLSDVKDPEGKKVAKKAVKTTVYKRSLKVIKKLKARYKGLCQITGDKLLSCKKYDTDVTEAHHIRYLSRGGLDEVSSNIIIISPEWHRVIHKENLKYDAKSLSFIFSDGKVLPIKFPGHLRGKRKRTKSEISYNMSRVKSKNTSIEKVLEKELIKKNIRFEKNYNGVIGKPDFVILEKKIAIFCDSAFWHGYKNMSTKRHDFKSNIDFWTNKIKNNIKRDKEVNWELNKIGWKVVRFWDFQIKKELKECIEKIEKIVKER